MSLRDVPREAVLEAIAELDRVGRDRFLTTYGFGAARSYDLKHEDQRCASKAIVGRAHEVPPPNEMSWP